MATTLLRFLFVAALLIAIGAQAEPFPPATPILLPDSIFRGATTVRWLGLPLYEAALWVENGTPAGALDYERPFVLRIRYARAIAGRTIAEVSREEIARLQSAPSPLLSQWHSLMVAVFPNVDRGTEIAGMHQPGVGIRFFLNGAVLADLPGDDFSRAFFGIWFDPATRNPVGRAELLGQGGAR